MSSPMSLFCGHPLQIWSDWGLSGMRSDHPTLPTCSFTQGAVAEPCAKFGEPDAEQDHALEELSSAEGEPMKQSCRHVITKPGLASHLFSWAACREYTLGQIITSKVKPSANSPPTPVIAAIPGGREGHAGNWGSGPEIPTHLPCDLALLCSLFSRPLFFLLYARPRKSLIFPKPSSVKHQWTLPLLLQS